MSGLSKSRILEHRQCPKRLWLRTYRPELAFVDLDAQSRMNTGNVVGEVARDLFPGGVLVDPPSLSEALEETRALLAGPSRPIFEATLEYDGVLIRADLLLPDSDGYRMVEVKSATRVKDYYYADTAVQSWVAQQAGLPLTKVEVAHIDTDFIYPGGGDYRGLFAHVDVSRAIASLVDEVPNWVRVARETLAGSEPLIAPSEQCSDPFDCPFMGYCSPSPDEDADVFPPEIFPHAGKLTRELRAEGYTDIRQIPEGRLISAKHLRIWRTTCSNQAELDQDAGEALKSLPYPRYYLDFETIQLAVPIWAGTRPYAQVPFQWSCHIELADGLLQHHSFLADHLGDPRPAFTQSLLDVLGKDGPIFVYNIGFERSRMQELALAFPEHAHVIDAAIDRLVDLLPIAREHYYHPGMRGSWSIKSVIQTIDPDLAYDGLMVANGGMAMDAFQEIMQAETAPERREELREGLLTYCERDTLAMVRLAHYFQGAWPIPSLCISKPDALEA